MIPLHTPVMPDQVDEYLAPPRTDGVIVDGTLGDGGHSVRFLKTFPNARVVGIDVDEVMGKRAAERLKEYGDRFELRVGWTDEVLSVWDGAAPDIVLMDLGISTYHYRERGRGFSFTADEPLDMRLQSDGERDASDIVNTMKEDELAYLIHTFGEERYSRRIARRIVDSRRETRITKAAQLAGIVRSAVPLSARHGRIHPATRTFQALRIAVNGELDRLSRLLELVPSILPRGGRFGVISFHSLEDRMVKWAFRERDRRFGGQFDVITPKPLIPTGSEARDNPASRSAKFRVLAKPGEGDVS